MRCRRRANVVLHHAVRSRGEALQEQVDKSIHNLCNNYLRDWVYQLFQLGDSGGNEDDRGKKGSER